MHARSSPALQLPRLHGQDGCGLGRHPTGLQGAARHPRLARGPARPTLSGAFSSSSVTVCRSYVLKQAAEPTTCGPGRGREASVLLVARTRALRAGWQRAVARLTAGQAAAGGDAVRQAGAPARGGCLSMPRWTRSSRAAPCGNPLQAGGGAGGMGALRGGQAGACACHCSSSRAPRPASGAPAMQLGRPAPPRRCWPTRPHMTHRPGPPT